MLAARPTVVCHIQLRGRRTRLQVRRTAGDGPERGSRRFQLQNANDIPAVARRRSHRHADEPSTGLPSARELQVAIAGPGSSAVRGKVTAARNVCPARSKPTCPGRGTWTYAVSSTTPNNPTCPLVTTSGVSHDEPYELVMTIDRILTAILKYLKKKTT